ncbi:unnamed protein product [Anisakis simplex]|uniref:TPR_REGION domain-containing protein n=1 Tax=Anisakis simplex TaxID=6269 RepID=A0A0M3K077_ANISI|nr:unnamed protein product [Anisakis simplex]
MARLYASLHYHIAMLNVDPILHYLCALTIYVNNDQLWARVGECAMQRSDWPTALFALENSSGWNALNGIIISMYKQRLYLGLCTVYAKLASILPFDQHYATGLAIKRAIRKSNAYWENKCREIFNEDAAYDVDDSVETVEMYDKDDGSMKGEDLNYSFEWNRRSTRFRTEFIIDDTNGWQEDTSRIDTCKSGDVFECVVTGELRLQWMNFRWLKCDSHDCEGLVTRSEAYLHLLGAELCCHEGRRYWWSLRGNDIRVINLFETSFNWSEVGDGDIECNVLTLIDAYIAVKNYNSAAVWLCRAIDYLSSFSSVDEALKRIHLLVDLRSVERETISNLVHSVVPLLMSEPHKTDLSLWIFVYESARLLEGERSVESLRALYASGSLMLNSSLNVLVIAHDMLAESECCYAENYRFLIFELRELANVRAERNVDEALSDGQHTEQLRAYYDELHQCLFCMFGCPSRLKRLLEEHGGSHSYEPSEEDAMFIASLLLPDPLPSYNDTLCSDLIEIVQKKLTQFIQPIDHETSMVAELENFISESKVCDWKRCISKYSKLRARVFYMLALNAFRLLRVDETLLYTKLFLVTSESGIDARILHCAWTMLSFFGVSALFTLTEDDLIMKLSSAIFPFRMSLHFDKDSQDVLFNFGSALYQIRSKLVRFGRKLDTDDIRVRWIRIRTAGMLEESRELFLRCASLLSAGDPDLWRCHYFLAKIDDKIGNSIESVMEHHYESARQLEASGVQYPMRINTKKQDHIEAVELHYRTYAYLIKWLIETDGIQWTREQLTKMLAFAETFCAMNEVDKCLYDAVERIHLTNSILTLCEEGFEVCIKRFPHFKSYYRLAQLSFYRGDYAMASSLIFTRLFARKKSCNPDNIFETLIAITQTDLDRGDSLQYHVYRIASLAITIASRTNDCVSLISLLHTFCTLIFCGNTDYLLAEDVEKVYRYTCSQLLKCVNEKVQNGEDSCSLAVHLYDLYQYAER